MQGHIGFRVCADDAWNCAVTLVNSGLQSNSGYKSGVCMSI